MRFAHAAALLATCAALALTGCSDDPDPVPDAGTRPDAGSPDAGSPDAGPLPDAGSPDAGSGTDGGTVSGPHVTTSVPAEGATAVYPLEMFLDASSGTPAVSFRKVVTLTFSAPMDATAAQVSLVDRTDSTVPPRALTGTWSSDGLTLTVTIPRPEDSTRPLEEDSRYALDLTGLKDAEGTALDASHAGLGDGRLDFTTGERDPELEHACTHVLVNTPEAVTAGRTKFAFPPLTDEGHARYAVTLPSGDAGFEGYTELISAPDVDEHVILYLDREVPVGVRNETAGQDVTVTLAPTLPVCQGITHTLSFDTEAGDQSYMFHFGPTPTETLGFVVERH